MGRGPALTPGKARDTQFHQGRDTSLLRSEGIEWKLKSNTGMVKKNFFGSVVMRLLTRTQNRHTFIILEALVIEEIYPTQRTLKIQF